MKFFALLEALGFLSLLIGASGFAQSLPNQTQGFGSDDLLTFTYTENFDCVDQPLDDLDFNGIPAAIDPGEFQIVNVQAEQNLTR